MDTRYNFYTLRGQKLPDDINSPVHEMLVDSLKCPEASEVLKELEKTGSCGEIQIFDKVHPKTIRVKTNYGMVEGYDLFKTIQTDRFTVVGFKHIKNHRLSMKKEVKDGRSDH
jgi:hypothetical protein